MLGRLDDDAAEGVEAGPAGAAGDLVELAGGEVAGADAVVLRKPREDDGADGHVDADAEGVGAADDLEQAGLGEGLDEAAVARQHTGVVDADPHPDEPAERAAEPGGEAELPDEVGDLVAFLPGRDLEAREGLGALDGFRLGEVDDVHRRLMGGQQLLERLVDRGGDVGEVQRYRSFRGGDDGGASAGTAFEVVAKPAHVAESGRHEHELGVGRLQQRHLPGAATVGFRVEVKLVHHDQPHVGGATFPQCLVGEHLGGGGDDRCVLVDGGVAGEHADVVGAKRVAQREELLRDERLDRGGVVAALSLGERCEVGAGRHQALARAGRGGQDDVRAVDDLDQRLGLGRIESQTLLGRPRLERVEQRVRRRISRYAVDQWRGSGGGHGEFR